MKRFLGFIFLCSGLFTPVATMADGAFFVLDKTPVGVPYQRALLFHDGTNETMLLQSEYQLPGEFSRTNLAWVVPVPAVPEIGSLDPDLASHVFLCLALCSRASAIRISEILMIALLIGLSATAVVGMPLCWISDFTGRPKWVVLHRDKLAEVAMLAFALFFLISILIGGLATAGSSVVGVEEVKHEKAGVYDVSVIKGTDSTAVMNWLRSGGFIVQDGAKAAFDRYARQGWYFVAAKVRNDRTPKPGELVAEGLVAPLLLKFPATRAIYPLALTATADRPTRVLLYVMSRNKLTCHDRLNLAFAEPPREILSDQELAELTKKIFTPQDFKLPWLNKFKGTLSPAEMAEDLVFEPVEDTATYREKVVVW